MVATTQPPLHRFFAPALDPGDEVVILPRDEAEHLTRVLRLGVGDVVAVFDGRGHEFTGRVATASRRDVHVQILGSFAPAREPAVSITLAHAVLKGDKMDEVVRDAVMLGVVAVQPLVTSRAEVTVAQLLRGARVERWRRVALASTKQSRRAVLPEIHLPLTFETYLQERRPPTALMLVEPGAHAEVETFAVLERMPRPEEAIVLVGPEGGWADAEWTAAGQRGIRLLTLGDRTLRADAVGVAALSILQFVWDGR